MKHRLTIKLTAGFVIIVLLSMLTIGAFFIQMFRQYVFESWEKTLLSRANSTSQMMSEYFTNSGPMRGMGGFMRFLDTMAEAKVWITDVKGNPLTFSGMGGGHFNQIEPLPPETENVISVVLSGKDSVNQSFSSIYNEETLTVGVPIRDTSGTVIGAVLLHSPITGITETFDKAIRILLISILAALILACGLGFFYSILFIRPLKSMNTAAMAMANGDYSLRSQINRKDELGQLGNSLDLLAAKLGYTLDQLFQEKNKLHDVISSISEGILAFDKDFKLINYNGAVKTLLDYTPQENVELKAMDDLKELGLIDAFSSVIIDGEFKSIILEKSKKILKWTLSPVKNSTNEIIGVVALIQDISESEKLEQMRKEFIANVSHEFRTPLTLIRGSVEAILDETVSGTEELDKYNKRILRETRSLERLVKDLLDLSHMKAGKLALQIEEVDINYLTEEVVKNMQIIAAKKNIEIELSVRGILPPISGDFDRLKQLFILFIDNAIKYSPENTKIVVDIEAKDYLTIKIKDHGNGIGSTDLPYIWDRFYKAELSHSHSDQGAGLGLAIAKHIIELHNGFVTVESELNMGTTIQIQLPLQDKTML